MSQGSVDIMCWRRREDETVRAMWELAPWWFVRAGDELLVLDDVITDNHHHHGTPGVTPSTESSQSP